jgi:Icc-related predicted phosphoesterase
MANKFLIVGDLHGHKPKIHYEGYDAIIAPGDFCSDESKKYNFEALRIRMKDTKSRTQWYDVVGRDKAKEIVDLSIKNGRKILEFLNSLGKPVFIVPGNWDWTVDKNSDWDYLKQDHFKRLIDGLKNIVNVYHKRVEFEGYEIIGHGISSGPEFPQYKEDKERLKPEELDEIKKDYERDSSKVSTLFEEATKPVIFLSHNVPFNTPIDEITNKESPRCGYHYGSLIAREMIDKYHPLVCIGGHMHEHFTKCMVGDTTAINAGFGSEVNVLLELDDGKIEKLEFHQGQ